MKKRKRKSNKKKFRIYDIFAIILLLASITLMISIIHVNILVFKFLFIIILVLLFINLINIFLIRKGKEKVKIFACISSLVLGILMTIGSIYIFKTTDVLSGSNIKYKTYNFSVLVLSDSEYKKIQDLDNKKIGYYEMSDLDSKLYINKISKKTTATFENNVSYNELITSLASNKVEGIIVEDSYLSMLKDGDYSAEGINNIETDTRIIYSFSLKVNVEDFSKDIDITKKAFSIYISGMDEYGTVSSVSRSDVNIVVTVNPKTRQILLTSIPRDYYVQLHGITGLKDKLTHAGLYGIESSVRTIEDLLDIEINYYIKVNFSSVVDIINAIGGVDVYSEYAFISDDGYKYSKGYNSVNGEEALSFVRERHAFASGDNQRGKNQQALIEAVIRKCASTSIIYKYNSLLNSLDGSFITNMSTNRITSIVKMQLNDMRGWNVTSANLVGSDGKEYTYSYSNQKLYVMIPKEESIDEVSILIENVLKGKTLESTYDGDSSKTNSVAKVQKSSAKKKKTSSNNSTNSTIPNNTTNNNNNDDDNINDDTVSNNKKNDENNKTENSITNNSNNNNNTEITDNKSDETKDEIITFPDDNNISEDNGTENEEIKDIDDSTQEDSDVNIEKEEN